MVGQVSDLPWNEPGWQERAEAWIHTALESQGLQASGPVEWLHQRAWSAFARVTTGDGIVYFKAPAPGLRFEAALAQALAEWRPDCSLPLLAVDLEQGWMLTPDSGVTLRSLGQTPAQLEHWHKLLPICAAMQIELAGRVQEALALGVPDRRLAIFPFLYERLLRDTASLRVGLPQGLTEEQYERLLRLRPRVAELCAQLAGCGLPETLVHEEIHENNVITGDGRYIFTDWSDSCVGHPFFSMLVTLRSVSHWLKLPEDGPEVTRLRDIYLEPWTAFAAPADLLVAFQTAYRLAMINRSLSYHHILGPLPEAYRLENDAIPGWLQDFLEVEDEE